MGISLSLSIRIMAIHNVDLLLDIISSFLQDDARNIVGWLAADDVPPELAVAHAGTRKKFKGLKEYEAYEVGPVCPVGYQFNACSRSLQQAVERRFKHFDWLHERLTNKYACIAIPPLPDKTFMAKHGEDFVEKRRFKLQQWLNRFVCQLNAVVQSTQLSSSVMRHPVLRRDVLALHHFITCDADDSSVE